MSNQNAALARLLAQYGQRISTLESAVSARGGPGSSNQYKHPYVAVVPLSIPATTTAVPGSTTISPGGDFVLTGMAAFWRQTSQALFRPIASITEGDDASPEVNAINFDYELWIGGTGWRFQNRPVPSPWLFSNFDRPRYMPTEFIIQGGESLAVQVTPTANPTAAGTLYFCFIGYKLYDVSKGLPSVDGLPGRRIPLTVPVAMAAANNTTQMIGQFTNGTDPFIVTNIGAAYKDSNGLYRPTSSITDNTVSPPVVNALDFLWRAETSGNDLSWSNDRVPSPMLFSNRERPFYLPQPSQVAPGSVFKVTVDPIVAPGSTAGTLFFMLDGFVVAQR